MSDIRTLHLDLEECFQCPYRGEDNMRGVSICYNNGLDLEHWLDDGFPKHCPLSTNQNEKIIEKLKFSIKMLKHYYTKIATLVIDLKMKEHYEYIDYVHSEIENIENYIKGLNNY